MSEEKQSYEIRALCRAVEEQKRKIELTELKVREMEITETTMKSQIKTLTELLAQTNHAIKENDDRMRTGWNRFFWILGGAFIASVWTWVSRGGLIGQ
jgi:hypothetical protein